MNKKFSLSILGIVFLVCLVGNVFALGVTPGRTTINFEPGLERVVSFTIVNTNNENLDVAIVVQGELKDYISISEDSFLISANEDEKRVSYSIKLPQSLDPGLRTANVIVVKQTNNEETSRAFIGANVGVATQVYVHVPYPGKYADASLNVVGPDSKGVVKFVLPVINRGELEMVNVNAIVDVYGALNEKVDTVRTNELGILGGERKEIVANWKPEVGFGKYRAVATLIYDGETKTLEKEFTIGQQTLEIQNIEVNDFVLGGIAKFEILVENQWNDETQNAFAEMYIYNDRGQVMAEVKSPNYNLPPLENSLMVFYWDTKGVKVGNYESELFLKFGQQSSKEDLILEVSENEIRIVGMGYVISKDKREEGNLVFFLLLIVGVLVAINLLWFLYFRRMFSNRRR